MNDDFLSGSLAETSFFLIMERLQGDCSLMEYMLRRSPSRGQTASTAGGPPFLEHQLPSFTQRRVRFLVVWNTLQSEYRERYYTSTAPRSILYQTFRPRQALPRVQLTSHQSESGLQHANGDGRLLIRRCAFAVRYSSYSEGRHDFLRPFTLPLEHVG